MIEKVNKEVIARFFSENVDWNLFFSAVASIGDSLNSQKNRFDKSDIFELAIEVYSDEKIKHHNQNYRDFYINFFDTYCEMKYEKNLLYNEKGGLKSKVNLTLINTMGKNEFRTELPKDYSDYLIAVDSQGCAVIDKETLCQYLDSLSDSGQIKAKGIPSEKFIIVRRPSEITIQYIENVDYVQAKLQLQKEFLSNIKKGFKKV